MNRNPNTSARETYTGTRARAINCFTSNKFFTVHPASFHQNGIFQLKKYHKAKKGENIIYNHKYIALFDKATISAIIRSKNTTKNNP